MRIPGTRQFALLPLADATVVPVAEKLAFPSVVLPAFHGGLIESPSGEEILSRVLLNQPVSDDGLLQLADEAISYASAAWQVPSLARADIPASVRRAGISPSCTQVAAELEATVKHYGQLKARLPTPVARAGSARWWARGDGQVSPFRSPGRGCPKTARLTARGMARCQRWTISNAAIGPCRAGTPVLTGGSSRR